LVLTSLVGAGPVRVVLVVGHVVCVGVSMTALTAYFTMYLDLLSNSHL